VPAELGFIIHLCHFDRTLAPAPTADYLPHSLAGSDSQSRRVRRQPSWWHGTCF